MKRWFKDRRRSQSGATLVELLVSLAIIGFAVVIVVGTFSTGLLNATLTKRNTAVQAVMSYELDKIGSSQFNGSAQPYSECFATDNPSAPNPLSSYQGSCPNSTFSLRADVAWIAGTGVNAGTQLWTVTVRSWPSTAPVGSPVSLYKANR